MARLSIPHHDISEFMWNKNHGVAEASSLHHQRIFSAVYDDACDVGFEVQGEREKVLFVLQDIENHDGETVAWHFRSFKRFSSESKFTITIYND